MGGLLQGGLELHLLGLKALPDFVNLVDGASTLADLVHDVLDLVGESLVLPADLLQLEHGLLVGRLHLEQLRGGVAGLLLADVQVEGKAVNLALPLADHLVELLGLPVHSSVEDLGLVKAAGHLSDLGGNLALGLLNLVQLGVKVVDGSLSLGQTSSELHLGHLEFLTLGNGVGLVLLTPALGLGLSLGDKPQGVLATSGLLLEGAPGSVKLVLEVPVLAQKKSPLASLVVAQGLDVVELGSKGSLLLGEDVQVVVQVANNAEKIGVLTGNLVLGGGKVTQSKVGIVDLLVDGVQGLQHLLVGHVSSGVSLLPLRVGEDGLLLDVGLLNVLAQLVHFCLPLLVELHLGGGGTAGLIQTLTKLVDLPGKVRPLPLGLGAGLALSLKLLLHGLDATLDLLDSLLGLGEEQRSAVELSRQLSVVLLLVANGDLEVPLGALKLDNTVLSHLQVTLKLPLLLLHSCPGLLLLVQAALQLTESRLKLGLDRGQVTDLLVHRDHVIVGLGLCLGNVLLLLVELVDDLVLLADLILEHLDGVVAVALLQLDLGDSQLDIFDLLLHHTDGSRVGLDLSSKGNPGALFRGENSLSFLQLTFGLDLGSSALGLPVGVDGDVALLLSQLLAHGFDLSLEAVHAALEVGGDIKGLLVLSPGGVGLLLQKPELLLRVGQADQAPGLLDEDKPAPVPAGQVLAEVPLANLDQLPLVELLLVDAATDPLEHLTLDHAHPLDHQLVTLLLEGTKGASAEEDKGVSEPVPLTVEGNAVHESPDGGLVVAGRLDGILTQARVAELEVGVEHPVGESTHADPDAFQHTVASQLVHDEGGLHLAGLLVGVGHKATHEVGLARVESGHQLNQGDKVDGRHSLAATLLLLLALVLGGSSGLARVVFPEENQQGVSGLALHDLDHRVVDGVLVLLKPTSDVVGHDASVVRDGKVGVLVSLGLGLQEDGKLAEGGLEFFLEGLIGGLGEEGLLLQDSPDAHGLLKHDDGGSQVNAEVNHDPVNALANVFLLLNDEHVVVEELLELLVHKVDGDLLEAVVLEDLEAGNVKHSAEVGLLHGGVD